MKVADILKFKGSEIISIGPEEPVASAVALLARNRIGAVLVMDGSRVLGILSERDVVRALDQHKETLVQKRVNDLMTREVVTCKPEDDIASIMGMMTSQRFRHVPVTDGTNLVGMISIGDVVRSRIEEAESEVDALRRYIAL